MLVDGAGKVLASASAPALPPPLDLLPKTVTVRLAMPSGVDPGTVAVRVAELRGGCAGGDAAQQ